VAFADRQENRRAARPNRPPAVGESPSDRRAKLSCSGRKDIWASRPLQAKRLLARVKAIADTGFLVAFVNRNDADHSWALAIARQLAEPLLTCEAVLAETAFHIKNSGLVLQFVERGLVRLAFAANEHLPRLRELAEKYQDRQPDFADLCLIRMSELHPRYPIVTTDVTDFRVYRRGRREVIPLICPE
jgi:uncharacterized protein